MIPRVLFVHYHGKYLFVDAESGFKRFATTSYGAAMKWILKNHAHVLNADYIME